MLLVSVIDELNNKSIDIKLPILWDDTVQQAKEKLFCYYNVPGQLWFTRFIQLKIDDTILQKESSTLIQYVDLKTEDQRSKAIKAKNLIDVIQNDFTLGKIFEMNDDTLNDLYETYKTEWVDLTTEDIEFCTRFVMFKSNPTIYSNLRYKIEEYLNNILTEKQKLTKLYDEEFDKLGKYYSFIQTNKYDEVSTKNIYSISILMKRKSQDNIPSRFINVTQLFNDMELSEKIPFVALSGLFLKRKQPAIRVYNQIFEIGVQEKEFKNWFVNEKVKLGQISYKKIKGILIKYKLDQGIYLSINLMETGDMNVTFNTNKQLDITTDYSKLNKLILDYIQEFMKYIDTTYSQIYRKGSVLDGLSNYELDVTNVTASGEVDKIIKTKLSTFLKTRYISETLFDPKDTLNKDVLSMFYKKYGKTILDEDDDGMERKGITTTVQNHPENLEQSLVTVNLANSYEQIIVIFSHLQSLGKFVESLNGKLKDLEIEDEFVFEEEIEGEHKLKMKSNIKQLKEQGVKVLSTNCQKQRQPLISDSLVPLDDSYELVFNNSRYICDKKDYPYPGFTNENIVCCFKKDQRRKEPYIRNMASQQLEESVQPSNFMIEVKHNDILYKTFVIKSLSDFKKHKYHFLNENAELIPIVSNELINKLDEKDDIFLEAVPINVIITVPPKNKCNYIPDFSKRLPEDIHAQCRDVHKDKKFFGYNLNGYPCCFDKPRKEVVTRKKKEVDVLKQHIITTDKILESNRLGTLPNGLDQLFNIVGKEKENILFYRMGVIQNNSSLLNVILLALDNKIEESNITSSIEFRTFLESYVNNNSNYKSLNQGDLSLTFTKDQFILYLRQNTLRPTLILDLLRKVISKNIIIVDYTNEHNINLLCSKYITFNQNNESILIIKKGSNYELVVKLEEDGENKKLVKLFNKSDKIVQLLFSYYGESCVIDYEYPDVYPYKRPLSYKLVIKVFEKSEDHRIVSQIVNEFNKTHLLVTKSNFTIPIMETGIIPELKILNSFLPELKIQLQGHSLLNKTIDSINTQFNKNIDKLSVLGQIVKENNVVALMTNYGIVIPLNPTEKIKNLQIYDYNYYPDVDSYLSKYMDGSKDNRVIYVENQKTIDYIVYKAKLLVADYLNLVDVLKYKLENTVKQTGQPLESKFEDIKEIVLRILSELITIVNVEYKFDEFELNDKVEKLQLKRDLFEFVVDVISHDILIMENDSEILNNFVSKPEFLHKKKDDNIDTLISNINDLDVFMRARKMEE